MAEELRAAIERADGHELAAVHAGELAAAHLVSRPQRLTPDLFARGAAVLDLLDRRAGEARPTISSIVPAVRRPPVSAPDLVPAYAASVFGPAARSAARGGAEISTGTTSAEAAPGAPAPAAGRSAVRAGTETTAVAPGAPTSAAGRSVARSESASTAVAPGIAGPASGRPTTSSGAAPTAASTPAAVRSAEQGGSEDAGEAGPTAGARPGTPIAPSAELSRSVALPAVGATAEVASEIAAPVASTAPAKTPAAAFDAPAAVPDAPAQAATTPEPVSSIPAPAEATALGFETAEVTRMVRDKVLEVTRRVAGSGASGRFDFFAPRAALAEPEATGFLTDELFGSDAHYDALVAGRPHGDEIEPARATSVPDAAVDDIEADRLADPVRAEGAPARGPAPVHRGHGVRFAPSESDRVRPGVPRPKPLPVDLTAHDDTEEIPRIDIRKHA